jgi:putative hydrolase of the HAD superfamily
MALRTGVPPPIRAVLFDADGVIQNGNSVGLATRVEQALGFVPEPFGLFTREVLEAEQPALSGKAELLELLEPIVAKWGAPGAALALATAWWCSTEADLAVLSLIRRLGQQGLLCALATNQQRFRASYMRQTFGYDALFERSFYSYELGCMKPDVLYFQRILASLPLAPGEILFIDDLAENVAAARSVGIQAAQFVHPRTTDGVVALRAVLQTFSIALRD